MSSPARFARIADKLRDGRQPTTPKADNVEVIER
jgi:hypothetical protein